MTHMIARNDMRESKVTYNYALLDTQMSPPKMGWNIRLILARFN